MFLNDRGGTWIEDSLGDEGGHDLSEGGVVLSTPVEYVFDDFGELIHIY